MNIQKLIISAGLKITVIVFITVTQAFSQSGEKVFSLKDCINYAKNQNSNIKTAKIDEEIADKKVNETLGRGLPQASISGNLVDNLELATQLIPAEFLGGAPGTFSPLKFGTKYSLAFTGQFSQLLFDGSFFIGVKAANEATNYYKQNSENVREDVLYSVASAYYQALIAQKKISLLEYNDKSLKKTLEDSELLFKNGKLKEVDRDRIKVSYNNLQYQMRNAKEGVKQAYNALKYKMGMPLKSQLVIAESGALADSVNGVNPIFLAEDGTIDNYENRIDYKLLKTNLSLLDLDRKNQLSKYLPVLSAYGNYTYQSQRKDFDMFSSKADWFKSYSIGIKMDIPISTGGQTYARVQQSALNISKLEEEIKNAELGIDLQVSNALTGYKNACNNVENETLNVKLAEKVFNASQLEYKEGTSAASVLVDAEMKYREAQTNYINSLYDVYIARLDMEKAKGNLIGYLESIESK